MSAGAPGAGGAPDFWHKKPMRTSPSWEENSANGGMPGNGGGGGGDARGGWGGSRAPPFTKEAIWSSKQFRVLCDMGYRKELGFKSYV